MRIEMVPLVLGVLVALVGVGLVADAWAPDEVPGFERRRRSRAPRNRAGEALVGFGTIAFAAALAGRDSWRYSTLAVLLGCFLLALGAVLNARYLREMIVFRGPARRDPTTELKPGMPPRSGREQTPREVTPPERRLRIR
ncbi:MAG TPA: hypothetical protein VNA89_15080 [Gemmatimonadaceae bacterium]|nr:hypothetical protein [Gemmatimonadaceae bacterium]